MPALKELTTLYSTCLSFWTRISSNEFQSATYCWDCMGRGRVAPVISISAGYLRPLPHGRGSVRAILSCRARGPFSKRLERWLSATGTARRRGRQPHLYLGAVEE